MPPPVAVEASTDRQPGDLGQSETVSLEDGLAPSQLDEIDRSGAMPFKADTAIPTPELPAEIALAPAEPVPVPAPLPAPVPLPVTVAIEAPRQAISLSARAKTALPIDNRAALAVSRPGPQLPATKAAAPTAPPLDTEDALATSDAIANARVLLDTQSGTFARQTPADPLSAPLISTTQPSMRPDFLSPQLDLASGDAWLAEVAKEIVAAGDAKRTLSFRLAPQELGRLDIALTPSRDGLSMSLIAERSETLEIVSAAQPRLADQLRSQGVAVADIAASVGRDPAAGGQHPNHQPAPVPFALSFDTPPVGDELATQGRATPSGRFA